MNTNIDSVVEKCVSINPRGNYLMLQTNLDELVLAETESGRQVHSRNSIPASSFLCSTKFFRF